jgi:Family of unknown function (DUF6511)
VICAVCPREARGFGWFEPKPMPRVTVKPTKKALSAKPKPYRTFHACSMRCMDIIAAKEGKMDSPTKHEIGAMLDAADKGGEFLNNLGKTDLATMTQDEWMQFVDSVCTGYVDAIRSRTGLSVRTDELVPF